MEREARIARALACALGSAVGGCVAEPATGVEASALVGGVPDGGDPAALLVASEAGPVCTATLIAPRVALTAGHCAGDGIEIVVDTGAGTTGEAVGIVAQLTHPGLDLVTLDHDLALLVLERDLPDIQPVPLHESAVDESWVGRTVRVIGFGRDEDGRSGVKREGTSVVAEVHPLELRLEPGPAQPCFGDSGGPVLIEVEGRELLAGVVSHGDTRCAEAAWATRVDAYVTDFLAPRLAETVHEPRDDFTGCGVASRPSPSAFLGLLILATLLRRRSPGHRTVRLNRSAEGEPAKPS